MRAHQGVIQDKNKGRQQDQPTAGYQLECNVSEAQQLTRVIDSTSPANLDEPKNELQFCNSLQLGMNGYVGVVLL